MCTAVCYQTDGHFFGRNLDLECSLGEYIVITPRRFPFAFRYDEPVRRHDAIIGVACVREGYPLYYDAANESGLWMAGLNFPESAIYQTKQGAGVHIAPYELIPWILARCASVKEAVEQLKQMRLVQENFSPELPATPLHWMIADRIDCVVVEPMEDCLRIYENPVGVLTNEPPFPVQMTMLRNYVNLTAEEPESRFAKNAELKPYSRGMGAIGLPGDLSSASRFAREAFTKLNAIAGEREIENVGQMFHILDTVAQCSGCCRLGQGKFERTVYSSCCDGERGIYYYTTYENRQITAVDMHREELDSAALISYPMVRTQQLARQNGNAE